MILAQSLLKLDTILPLALFGTFAALAWWVLDMIAAGRPRALERLEEIKDPGKRRKAAAESALKKSAALTRVLEKATPSLAKPLQPKNAAEMSKLKTKLSVAGFRSESAGSIFLGLKFAGLVIGWKLVITAYLIGIFSGALAGVALMALGRRKRSDAIPFGPFLSFGVVISVFFGHAIINWYLGLLV
jgi:prepilin signal peptidase PulO-like enzyme (type II secretory pathway)